MSCWKFCRGLLRGLSTWKPSWATRSECTHVLWEFQPDLLRQWHLLSSPTSAGDSILQTRKQAKRGYWTSLIMIERGWILQAEGKRKREKKKKKTQTQNHASLFAFWNSDSRLARASVALSPGMFFKTKIASPSCRVFHSPLTPTCLLLSAGVTPSAHSELKAESGWVKPGLHLPARLLGGVWR